MTPIPVDMERVKNVVNTLVQGEAIDTILKTMDHGFGNVEIKVNVQNGIIKLLSISNTKTVKID
jgi:predicted ATP-grasp superfamily ATP-dependent carboligase